MVTIQIVIILSMTAFLKAEPRYKEPERNYTIFELDERVAQLLSRPEPGKSYELYQLVYTLHLDMLHMHEVVHFHLNDSAAMTQAREILHNNGLQIFNTVIYEDELKELYKFNNAQMWEIVDLVKNCQRLYNSTEPILRRTEEL